MAKKVREHIGFHYLLTETQLYILILLKLNISLKSIRQKLLYCFHNDLKHNDLMSEKHKKTYKYLNYVEHLLILSSTVNSYVSVFTFVLLVCVPVGIITCAITAGIKKYKSIIKEKKKKHDKIVFLEKDKLNTIEVLIWKALIDSCISHDEFVSVNNMLRE